MHLLRRVLELGHVACDPCQKVAFVADFFGRGGWGRIPAKLIEELVELLGLEMDEVLDAGVEKVGDNGAGVGVVARHGWKRRREMEEKEKRTESRKQDL